MFSDGPATQYKQKGNFFCLSTEPFDLGFEEVSWNYFEASHGKGAPDGIGGSLKRTADRLIRLGTDIASAEELYQVLSNRSNIKLYLIEPADIDQKANKLSELMRSLRPVPGTMKLHQVLCMTRGKISYRNVSCLCRSGDRILNCTCFSPQSFEFDATNPIEITDDDSRIPGRYCIVLYDDRLYPGIIKRVHEHSMEIDCMRPVGRNRFCWPTPRDISWYPEGDVLSVIPEPVLNECRRPYFTVDEDILSNLERRFLQCIY